MASNRIFSSEQCAYCQCGNFLGCMRCKNNMENRVPAYYKSKQQPLAKYLSDVAQGNIRTKKAWEMLPIGWQLLFLAIVLYDENGKKVENYG